MLSKSCCRLYGRCRPPQGWAGSSLRTPPWKPGLGDDFCSGSYGFPTADCAQKGKRWRKAR